MPTASSLISSAELAILTAPLNFAQARWTSDEVAQLTGTSQSTVARTWLRSYELFSDFKKLPQEAVIHAVEISKTRAVVICEIRNSQPLSNLSSKSQLMRSPRRTPIQTLLAAGLLNFAGATADQNFEINASLDEDKKYLVFSTAKINLPTNVTLTFVLGPLDFQKLLLPLIQISHLTSAGNLRQLHHELVTWAANSSRDFLWQASPDLDKRAVAKAGGTSSPLSIPQVIADQSFEWIVERIWNGELTAGDRITETGLAKGLRTTRNQSIDALRTLASAGIIDHHPIRGYLVPKPTPADISEVYAARRLIGEEILTRVISNPNPNVDAIKASLDRLIDLAKTGNSYETGTEDMFFQNNLAESSGLRNYPQIFATLAKQLRMYIAVLGLSYFYPVADMVKDDTEIYRNIKARNLVGALNAWNKKIDDSKSYMTKRVSEFK